MNCAIADSGRSRWLPESGDSQCGFIRAAGCAAVGQFAVDHDGGDSVDAKTLGARGHSLVLHVEHFDVARRAGDALDEIDGVVTQTAAGTEDFDFSGGCHCLVLLLLMGKGVVR